MEAFNNNKKFLILEPYSHGYQDYKDDCICISIIGQVCILFVIIIDIYNKVFDYYFLIFYFIYIITQLTSRHIYLLYNMETIDSLFKRLFYSSPDINFSVKKNSYGDDNEIAKIKFDFYSSKDISGLIELNTLKNKKCLFVIILFELYPADDISEYDKNNLRNQIEKKYEKFYIVEQYNLSNKNKGIILKIDNRSFISHFINIYTNIFFILICASKLYDIFLYYYWDNNFSDKRGNYIKIRKMFSTRYNLSDNKYQKKYEKVAPCVKINEELYYFDENKTVQLMKHVKPIPPTEEELKKANNYKTYEQIDRLIKRGKEYEKKKFEININYLVKVDQNKSQFSQYELNV